MPRSGRGVRRLTHSVVAAAVAAVVLQSAPAHAAPAAPQITGPSGTTGPSVELSWEPVSDAVSYEVWVDNDPAFGSPEWTSVTANTVSVPTKRLAVGSQHVQVRAKDAANAWSSWSSTSFDVGTTTGPTLTAPDDGIALAQPADPPLLTWTPVPGAVSYTVEVDTEDQFVSPATYTTKVAALVVPDNQAPGTYHWRVRAVLSNAYATDHSASRTYVMAPIAQPAVVGPSNDEDVEDVVLDWEPVPGAKHYELQVDDDVDFSSPELAAVPDRILGTRFSPATTFGNDQYFWRVRARDLDDNPTAWVSLEPAVHYAFDRVWRDVPSPVHPYDQAGGLTEVDDDLYFEWTPVQHASHYELWVSTDANFTEPSTSTVQCLVAGTTFTPGEITPKDACMPKSEGVVHYWKVRPLDSPYAGAGVTGIFSPTQQFVYRDAEAFTVHSPTHGSTVKVPTLDWEPVPGTEVYEVSLLRGNGTQVTKKQTHSTSFTPMGVVMDAAEGPFTYELRALDAADRTSETVYRTFNLSAVPLDTSTPLQPFPEGPTYDAPGLVWGAVEDAHHYRLHIGNAATNNWFTSSSAPILDLDLPFPAATDLSTLFLNAGTYQWRVSAYDRFGFQIAGPGPIAQFEVLPLEAVTGHRLALTGSSLDAGAACTATLTNGGALCDGVPSTPVLDWNPVPYASEYRVHVSRDGDFTTGALDPTPPRAVTTRWAPTWTYPFKALQDSQAQTPYHWVIQACKSATQCGPDPTSTVNPAKHAFRKSSPDLELLTPSAQATIGTTEVTFTWEDYFTTNQAHDYAVTGEASYQSAMQYQVQVDNESTFASPLDDVLVDQTTYTAAETIYPEGPLWWRVQPIDGNGNSLGWSDARQVVKATPVPVLTSPEAAGGTLATVSSSVPFRWVPQPFAASYDIQVARNADRTFSTANLVLSKNTKRAAFVPATNLAASDSAYTWRVRRVDAFGNKGAWSAPGEFRVALLHPTLLSPAAAATVGRRGLVLRWAPVAEAATYRVELRRQGSTSITTTPTPSTAWAPLAALLLDTTYEWRVTSLDADGNSSAPSAWRTFTIGGVPTATTAVRIEGPGTYDTDLTAVPPTWSVPDVTTTYQWRRNAVAVPGATGTTYRVTADDVGASITVVATGTSSEFGTGTSTSAAVTGLAGPGATATSAPQISGSGAVGTVLSSTGPTWNPAETTSVRQWMRNGGEIAGATGATYTVVAGDVGASITLRVTGTLPGRTSTVTLSNAITGVQGSAPTATSPPVVNGTPKVGTTLTSTAPTWQEQGVANTMQWLRDGQPISGAIQASYLVRAEDVNAQLTVRYTGTLPGRAAGVVVSDAVTGLQGDAPTATTPPTITGSRKVGTTLTSTAPTWNLAGVQQTVQWLRNGLPVDGETTASYLVRAGDVDAQLAVRYTGTLPGRATGSTTSTPVVGLLGDAPLAVQQAAVSGTRRVGSLLTALPPTWNVGEVEQSRQWLRNGVPVDGETGPTYLIRPEDLGASLAVRYTARAPGRADGTSTSGAVTALLGDAPVAQAMPAPAGTGRVGSVLEAPEAVWNRTPETQSRQWLVSGVPVAGETGATYTVRPGDAGLRITVRVTAESPGYATGTVTSSSVLATAEPVVVAPPAPTPAPAPTPPPPAAAPVTSTTVLRVPAKVRASSRAVVTVRVTAPGFASPTGTLKVLAGNKAVGKATLAAGAGGAAKIRLARLPIGRHKVLVRYSGATGIAASKSRVLLLNIVR